MLERVVEDDQPAEAHAEQVEWTPRRLRLRALDQAAEVLAQIAPGVDVPALSG